MENAFKRKRFQPYQILKIAEKTTYGVLEIRRRFLRLYTRYWFCWVAYYSFRVKISTFRINYRLTSRTKPKSAHVGGLMPNGSPLPGLNGYTQTLINSLPQYSQKYCNWLTNGFKVQSFRAGGHHQTSYSHARPPPPLLQYINRPKTVGGRVSNRKPRTSVDMNIVGVQKEVSQH